MLEPVGVTVPTITRMIAVRDAGAELIADCAEVDRIAEPLDRVCCLPRRAGALPPASTGGLRIAGDVHLDSQSECDLNQDNILMDQFDWTNRAAIIWRYCSLGSGLR
jgi:hypothetical protein